MNPDFEYPGQDQQEWTCREAQEIFATVERYRKEEMQAVRNLEAADGAMKKALRVLDIAADCSQTDVLGGGTLANTMERDALPRAKNAIGKVEKLVGQAQWLSPEIQSLRSTRITSRHILSDVAFDNPFSDMYLHEKIKACWVRCHQEARSLRFLIVTAKDREVETESLVEEARKRLEGARKGLRMVRQGVFEMIDQLPLYEQANRNWNWNLREDVEEDKAPALHDHDHGLG